MEDWTITVEDFGRIERAEVEIKPLTVLVGRNNSGKSYLASLVWGIEAGGLGWAPFHFDPVEEIISPWIGRAIDSPGTWCSWTDSERRTLQAAWRDLVDDRTWNICHRLFARRVRPLRMGLSAHGFQHTWLARTDDPSWKAPFEVSFSTDENAPEHSPHRDFRLRTPPLGAPLMAGIAGFQRTGQLSDEYGDDDAIFLPAARTGFSLFLPVVVATSLAAALHRPRSESLSRFTLPQVHLLSALASGFSGKPGPFANEAEALEQECLEGMIVHQAETGTARYAFKPSGTKDQLDLQVTSALVTELMPLVVALRNAQEIPFLVLEEPEAHLHPRIVRAVIRCLCRLVRRGVRVLITTHSATVAQQVNNLVKLGSLDPDRRAAEQSRFGYAESEYLRADEVSVNEFRFRDDGRTVVDRIPPGVLGFPMPTFNEALQEFAAETLHLNELLEPESEGD